MSISPLRIIFAGTPEFAAVSLRALLKSPHQVVAVYSQPDRPAGRGRKLQASPVKQVALDAGVPVYQPVSLKSEEEQARLAELDADLMVVAAYGLLLPAAVLKSPRLGCVNIHASLLPRWRGAAPIQHALLAGDRETGITIMQMDVGLDTGDMLNKSICDIAPNDNASSLHDRLASMGADALIHSLKTLPDLQQKAEKQDDAAACYAHKINKADAQLNWAEEASQLARQVRAYYGWPVAYSEIDGERVRIWQVLAKKGSSESAPGTIMSVSAEGIEVACGNGSLLIQRLQLAGGKALAAAELLNANQSLLVAGKSFDAPVVAG